MKAGVDFEYVGHLDCTAMSAQGAREFFGGCFFKVICMGQAVGAKYKFGARHYRLFRTEADWRHYEQERANGVLED